MSDSDSSKEENEFSADYPRKRKKQTKEDRMLGVFGSDSDEHEQHKTLFQKNLHRRGVSFQRADNAQEESDVDITDHERPSFRSRSSIDRPTQEEYDASERSSVDADARPVPSFGVFTESARAFVPSARPAQSREMPTIGKAATSYIVPSGKKMSDKAIPDKSSTKLRSGKAAKMMAMMGYKAGEGLGLSGKGIINPIEAKLRSGQKAGLGSTEEQEQTEGKGHRRVSRAPNNVVQSRGDSGETTRSRKVKYKTSREIAEEAGGNLVIPKKLQAIIDMTGSEPKSLADAVNVEYAPVNHDANQHYNVSQNARQQVELYASNWRTLQDRKAYLTAELERTQSQLNAALGQASFATETLARAQEMTSSKTITHDLETELNRLVPNLEEMQKKIVDGDEAVLLDDVAISLLAPIFQQCMSHWNVLSEPSRFIPQLQQLSAILRIEAIMSFEPHGGNKRNSSPFESFMSTVWFSRVRTAFGSDSQLVETMLEVLEAWSPLTPPYLRAQIINQLVTPRLIDKIQKWNPKAKAGQSTLLWLFQWLPYLAGHVSVLIPVLKRKFTLVINHWKPSDGVVRDLLYWSEILGQADVRSILLKQVLPKLAEHLRRHLVIDPADQKLEIFHQVLDWRSTFTPIVMAELLKAEFFPKWIKTLYDWLRNDPDFAEISHWYEWWQQIIPQELVHLDPIQDSLNTALQMMDTTLEHGAAYLKPLAVGPAKPIDHLQHLGEKRNTHTTKQQKTTSMDDAEITFKDVVEDWCQHHNYLLVPLRRAHDGGDPLYRLTAHEKGMKGVILYLKGDVVMAQEKETNSYNAASFTELASLLG